MVNEWKPGKFLGIITETLAKRPRLLPGTSARGSMQIEEKPPLAQFILKQAEAGMPISSFIVERAKAEGPLATLLVGKLGSSFQSGTPYTISRAIGSRTRGVIAPAGGNTSAQVIIRPEELKEKIASVE